MKKKYCFDIDGVICKTKKNFYHKSIPIQKNIKAINKLYNNGNIIIIFTARFMGRSKENKILARQNAFIITTKQLKKWGVRYHKLIFGKPSFDVLIDDKCINHDFNWAKNFL